jgi:hypothetical protein
MAETTASQTAGPLQLLESGAVGYCDPVTGLCVLPAAVPELHGDLETTTLPDHAKKVVVLEFRPIAD